MKYNTFILTKSTQLLLETEILYNIASARANGVECLKLEIADEDKERIESHALKILRATKKQGRIRLFINSRDIKGASTEAEYLRNKHPEIVDLCAEETNALVVMV